ncbi:Uncharacterised protein [Mycobacteroides abscessus subsp. abscessus]|nr:Uncharacterised protein [Mycobacteroides abscessus subsp. abscessus]
MTPSAVSLVSTIASLQNWMPVQAIVVRRNSDGRASRPISRAAATKGSTSSSGRSRTTIFW